MLSLKELPDLPALLLFIATACILVYLARRSRRCYGLPLPPGPRGMPFIGNISHMRKPQLWRAHQELCEKFGDIVYVPVMGQSIIVLGSPRAITDILEKRSAITSDRQQSPLIALTGHEGNFSMLPYSQWWRRHRRAFWQHFLPASVGTHFDSQRSFAHMFLRKLLSSPTRLREHIRFTFSAAIVKVVYGFDVSGEDDEHIVMMEKVLGAGESFLTGEFLVEYLPFLRYIPEWMPGAGFQKVFAEWRNNAHSLGRVMVQRCKTGMAQEETSRSVVAKLLERLDCENNPEGMQVVQNVGFTAFVGGADTTFSTLQTFFLAMTLYPDVQRRAQAELDAVVGPHRLPSHRDQARLPYINAIVKEAIRWQPVVPLALPHMSTEDIEYNGHCIPAGSVIFGNAWACLHDPTTYPDPERFWPERFLRDGKIDPALADPSRFAFGFGRRICPGRHYAEASLFIHIAMLLHAFNITPPRDENGGESPVELEMSSRIVSYPKDCRCTIEPRSERARELVLADTG